MAGPAVVTRRRRCALTLGATTRGFAYATAVGKSRDRLTPGASADPPVHRLPLLLERLDALDIVGAVVDDAPEPLDAQRRCPRER